MARKIHLDRLTKSQRIRAGRKKESRVAKAAYVRNKTKPNNF